MTLDFENLDDFFKTDEFATVATLSGGATIDVIFDNAHTGIDAGGYEVTTQIPMFTAKTSDVSSLASGSSVTINGQAYTVRDKHPNGTGVTEVFLHEYA